MDGQTDGQTDGQKDGQTHFDKSPSTYVVRQ